MRQQQENRKTSIRLQPSNVYFILNNLQLLPNFSADFCCGQPLNSSSQTWKLYAKNFTVEDVQ